MVSADFEEERREEERQEADAEDIEDAEFQDHGEDEEIDSLGSLRDFIVDEEGMPDIGSPHASAFLDDSDFVPGRPFAKNAFAQKRKRVVMSDDEQLPARHSARTTQSVPSPTPSAPTSHSRRSSTPPPSIRSQSSSQNPPTLSQAYTPSVPHNRAIQPFEQQLYETVQKGPQAKVLARISNKYEQFRVFSLMQDLWTVALNFANNSGRKEVDLHPRGTSVSEFLQHAQDLANLMQDLDQDSMPEEAFVAQSGVRTAYKAYDPTPTEEEEAEEASRSKKKKGSQEGKDRLRLISYIQVRLS